MARANDKKADSFRNAGKYDEYTHRARSIRDMEPGRGRANVDKQGRVVGESTHKMAHERIDDRWVAFPTLFPDKERPGRWRDYTPDVRDVKGKRIDRDDLGIDGEGGAYQHAKSEGEVFEFGQNEKEAGKFAKGSWKDK